MISAVSALPVQAYRSPPPPEGRNATAVLQKRVEETSGKSVDIRKNQESQKQKSQQQESQKNSDAAQRLGKLSDDQKAQVEQLVKTDREVRAHEQAHKNAGGQYAGSASFQYVAGPDGKRYAVAGEVPIDVSVEENPEDTISKMTVVISAALAPAKPSGQDRKVAGLAVSQRAEAQAQLTTKRRDELSGADQEETPLTAQAIKAYEVGAISAAGGNNEAGNILNFIS